MRRNVVLWVLPLVALAVLAAAMTFLIITLPPRQQTITNYAGRPALHFLVLVHRFVRGCLCLPAAVRSRGGRRIGHDS